MTAIVTGNPVPSDVTTAAPLQVLDADRPGRGRRRRRTTAICLLTYVAISLAAFLPHGPLDSHAIPAAGPGNPAGSDPFQMMWFLSWLPYALTHGLNIFHTNLFDYPQGVNLADNTSVPLLGLLAWPITATLGPIASFNFLLHLAFVLSAASMFLVLRRWCASLLAPFLGGLLYGFGPYMVGQELHLDLVFVPIPPLLVLCADELVRTQRMRPWRLGLLIGACAAAQLLVSPDVLSGCIVMAVIAAVTLAVVHRRVLREHLSYIVSTGGFATATFALVCGYLIWYMIAGPHHLLGAVIPTSALQGLHADLLGPIVPTSNQLWPPYFLAHLGNDMVSSNLSENGTYLGLPLVVMLVVIARRLRHDSGVRAFSWLALAAFVLSLGPTLTIATLDTHIPLPEAVFAHLPLFDNTIPARYALYASLFAAMVLAIGLDRLWQRRPASESSGLWRRSPSSGFWRRRPASGGLWQSRPPRGSLGETPPGVLLGAKWRSRLGPLGADTVRAKQARVGLVAAVTVLSLLPSIPFPSRPTPWPASLTANMRRLVPPGSVVLAYPYPTPLHSGALLWEASTGMDFHLVGGYANIQIGRAGHRWPQLLSPPYVQELLGYSAVGDQWPLPGPVNSADLQALHIFLARYSVGAVVYWASSDDPYAVYSYLAQGLGPPRFQNRAVAIWLPVNGRWRSPPSKP